MPRSLQLYEVAVEIDEVGGRVPAVDPREGGGGGAPARDQRGDVEVGVAEAADGVVHQHHGVGELVAAAAGGGGRAPRGRPPPPRGRGGGGGGGGPAARSAPSAAAPSPAAVGPVSAASAIASQAPSRFSTKSNQSPPTS